jgi:hypothetical protein
MHPAYKALVDKATASHGRHRNPEGISADDVHRARLYSYAFRLHTIGAFHATRLALAGLPAAGAWRTRAMESLEDLANLGMEAVPADFRAVIGTFYRYHQGIGRVLDSLRRDHEESRQAGLGEIAERFTRAIEPITAGNGIHLTQDLEAPAQASFVVPNLGIIIVPLVYGDHHSWNLAFLTGNARDVPVHRHHQGVEIHLGYDPTEGVTILGEHRAPVRDGYAMPIPPETDHGWVNTSAEPHHVPFIFGSLYHAGWGVFLDVEASTRPVEEYKLVARDSAPFSQMVYLERAIARAVSMKATWRSTLIPHTVTNRRGSGGLELCLTRVGPTGFAFPKGGYRIVSVVRGKGAVTIEAIDREVESHDHFGIPAGMRASIQQKGPDPLIVLDVILRSLS